MSGVDKSVQLSGSLTYNCFSLLGGSLKVLVPQGIFCRLAPIPWRAVPGFAEPAAQTHALRAGRTGGTDSGFLLTPLRALSE